MGQKKSESRSSAGRSHRTFPLTSSLRSHQSRRMATIGMAGTLLLIPIFTLFLSRDSLSVGKVLLKSIGQEQRLMSCSSLRQRTFYSEELMFTMRNWPTDEDFNTGSNCINDNSESNSADMTHCQCRNPTVPLPRTAGFWQVAFDRNQALAKVRADDPTPLDLVILGDSITEHWMATTGGMTNNAYAQHQQAFQEILTRKGGGAVDGLALGIAADRLPNLLFRLRAAGYAKYLRPSVWWIEIGTNDMAMGWCNADAVLAGNIAIVEEILQSQPNAKIVINSVLPRLPAELRPHIDEVNMRLRQYACETKANVYFYNATSIFRDEKGNAIHLPDGVHPDGPSSYTWAKDIARTVEELSGTWW